MDKSNILITGINGEMGHGLVKALRKSNSKPIIGLDLKTINNSIKPFIFKEITGNILDPKVLEKINIGCVCIAMSAVSRASSEVSRSVPDEFNFHQHFLVTKNQNIGRKVGVCGFKPFT